MIGRITVALAEGSVDAGDVVVAQDQGTRALDEALYERAQVLLQRPRATAAQVAEALGYAELSSFYRAFRRWSGGQTPSAYRRHQRGPRVA